MPTSLPRRLQAPFAGAPAAPAGATRGRSDPGGGVGLAGRSCALRVPAPPSHLQKGTLSSG